MPAREPGRPDPEHLLQQVEAEEAWDKRGRLKVFLGYASGVGKSYTMFDEGRRRSERGQDVVVGAMQAEVPGALRELVSRLDVIPTLDCGGTPVMDVQRILDRHPQVCLVDGLAYDNPPGCTNPKRWEDVEQLLANRISVITTINLQYITEYSEAVQKITGKSVAQTVPVSFIHTADEIVVVDAPPESVMGRVDQLSQLRELALLLAADVVDRQLESNFTRAGTAPVWGTQERVLVCLTPRANATKMIESARRSAQRFHGEFYACYVTQGEMSPDDQKAIDRNLELARAAGAKVEILEGHDAVDAILNFARSRGITQIYIGQSRESSWWTRFIGTPVDRLLDGAETMDVRVFPQ